VDLHRFISDSVWRSIVPKEAYSLAREDLSPYEFDGKNVTFPHIYKKEVDKEKTGNPQQFYNWLIFTPFVDIATMNLARVAVKELSLGQRNSVDYLSIVVSMIDHIGHRYGPLSQEILDHMLRLDRELQIFFDFLDQEVGSDRYIMAVTADHGAAIIPEYLNEINQPGYRITRKDMETAINKAFNAVNKNKFSPAEEIQIVEEILEKFDFIADAITEEELIGTDTSDPYINLFRNSYYPNRRPIYPLISSRGTLAEFGIRVRFIENAGPYFAPSTHGSPYKYDRHVPFVVMGINIKSGESSEYARTVDIAPTLAKLAGIQVSEKIDGKPLTIPLNNSR
jgi:predicted AlkP superfamily pyrophosphatase or phosphodiesterase